MEKAIAKHRFSLKVLTLNIFLRPPFVKTNSSDHKNPRLNYFIQNCMQSYDLICLQEMFASFSSRKEKLKKAAREMGFFYMAESPNPGWLEGSLVDGGLLVLSKYPIVQTDFETYSDSMDTDSLSQKGCLYTQVSVDTKTFHVFSTHMQASYSTSNFQKYRSYRNVRRTQLQEIRRFMDHKASEKGTVLLLGDLNIDARAESKPRVFSEDIDYQDEYAESMSILSGEGRVKLRDIMRERYGESPSTYGRVDEKGQPLERVLTAPRVQNSDESIDYVLLFGEIEEGTQIDFEQTEVVPFYVENQPFTQMSDHAGLQALFYW